MRQSNFFGFCLIFCVWLMVGFGPARADTVCPDATGTISVTQKAQVGAASGSQTICGAGASATGLDSVAVGPKATASGSQAIAIGYTTRAVGGDAVVIGTYAGSTDDRADGSIAIGIFAGTNVTASENVAIGVNAGTSVGGLGLARTDITCVWGSGF